MDKISYISDLLVLHLLGELTDEQQEELKKWVEQSDENSKLFEHLTNADSLSQKLRQFDDCQSCFEKLLKFIKPATCVVSPTQRAKGV